MPYVDVVLPLPLRPAFTYEVNQEQAAFLQAGMRVVVPFGKSKIYISVFIRNDTQKIYIFCFTVYIRKYERFDIAYPAVRPKNLYQRLLYSRHYVV